MVGKPIFISKCGELILTNSTSEHSSLSYSLSNNLHQVLFSKRSLVIAIKHFFFFWQSEKSDSLPDPPRTKLQLHTHTLAAFLQTTWWPCVSLKRKFSGTISQSLSLSQLEGGKRGHALVWYFFLAASPVKDGEVHTTLKCSQECMLWDELDRATFSG